MRLRSPAAGCILILLGLAGGCMGGEDADGFREQADAICADYDGRIAEIAPPTDLDALAASSGEIADLLEARLAQLEALGPPEGAEADYEDWLRLNEEAVVNARAIQEAAAAEDEGRIGELADGAQDNERRSDELADELGLEECLIDESEVEAPSAR